MPAKTFDINDIGIVSIFKRKGSKSIRLGFDSTGNVRISIPTWVPYQAGITFALNRIDWINQHKPNDKRIFNSGDMIGKTHHIRFVNDKSVKTARVRLKGTEIIVKYPPDLRYDSPEVQTAAERGAKKALWSEAERLLPQRLKTLADKHGFNYRSITVKQLKTKWGSCNQRHEITLNYYLMQLPWQLIDYVLTHELVHTEHLNHSTEFWQRFEKGLPNAKKIRNELKTYKTAVIPK